MSKFHGIITDSQGLLENYVYIYALRGPDGAVRYVGSTVNPQNRMTGHIRSARETTAVGAWVASLLASGIEPEMLILERCERTAHPTWHPREAHWIAVYGGMKALLNTTDTGTGGGSHKGWKHSKKTRDKMRIKSPEHIEKLRHNILSAQAANRGRKHPEGCLHCTRVRSSEHRLELARRNRGEESA